MPRGKKKEEAKPKGMKSAEHKAEGSRGEKLGSVVQLISKAYGSRILHSPSEENVQVVPRISTGIYGLDYATNGGLPVGRVTMTYGHKSSGKTTTYLRALGHAQMLCANCYQPGKFKKGIIKLPNLETGKIEDIETQVIVSCPCGKPKDVIGLWCDAEGAWITDWAAKMGVWPEKVILLRPEYGEQSYDTVMAFVQVKEIDIIVIDSLAALTPSAEFQGSMEQAHQGVSARMNNKFLRKLTSGMNAASNAEKPVTVWLVNQLRQKIGVMFGSPDVLPGGMGQTFTTSLEVEFRASKIKVDEKTDEPLYGEFHYTVKKNRVGVQGGKGEFRQSMVDTQILHVGDLLEHEFVIDKAVIAGLIDHPTNVSYQYGGETFRGKNALIKYLIVNQDVYSQLKADLLQARLNLTSEVEMGDEDDA